MVVGHPRSCHLAKQTKAGGEGAQSSYSLGVRHDEAQDRANTATYKSNLISKSAPGSSSRRVATKVQSELIAASYDGLDGLHQWSLRILEAKLLHLVGVCIQRLRVYFCV